MTTLPELRILVVGCGFIGSHAASAAAAAGLDTHILTRSEPHGATAARVSDIPITVGDAADPEVAADAVSGRHVLYTAGGLMPGPAEEDPARDAHLSLEPLLTILRTLGRDHGPGITFVSSGGTVYGRPTRMPVSESHPTEPISAYGVSKLASERYVQALSVTHGFPARILRCANVYGKGQPADRGQGAVAAFLDAILNDRPVVLFGDGSVIRDYVHVDDVAEVLVDSARRAEGPRVLNVGSGVGTSLKELVARIEDLTERRATVEHRPPRAIDLPEIVLDVTQLRAWRGLDPLLLDEGLRRTVEAS